MRTTLTVSAALLMAGLQPASAQSEVKDIATGAVYVVTVQADGSATVAGIDSIDVYTLHADLCVADHPVYGLVSWKAADGGWQISLDGTKLVSFEGEPPATAVKCAQ